MSIIDGQKEAAQMAVEWISRWMEMDPERGIHDPYFAWAASKLEEMHNNPKQAALYMTGFVHLCGQLMVDIASNEVDDYEDLEPEAKLAAGRRVLQETILNMMSQ